jgi:hypothetical protein
MGRSHLHAYHYHDARNFEGIREHVNTYHQRILEFINDINSRMRLEISYHIPTIQEYDSRIDQTSDYYHFGNILHHMWNEFWEDHGELKVGQCNLDYKLIREPGVDTIAVGDKDS